MKVVIAVLVTAILSGCSSIGQSDFSCSGLPKGVKCQSARQNYHQMRGESTSIRSNQSVSQTVNHYVGLYPDTGQKPIRTPSQIMRVFINSYEDSQTGHLITPGLIHVEVNARRWTIGNVAGSEFKNIKKKEPLKK